MQVYSFRYRSMTYMIFASLWPLSHQVHTFRFGSMTYVVYASWHMQVLDVEHHSHMQVHPYVRSMF